MKGSCQQSVQRAITATLHRPMREKNTAWWEMPLVSSTVPVVQGFDHIVTAFIDPFFSSGVHLALTSGLSAAASIAASIRGDCPESDAAEWHTQRVSMSYTRYDLLRFCVLQLSSR